MSEPGAPLPRRVDHIVDHAAKLSDASSIEASQFAQSIDFSSLAWPEPTVRPVGDPEQQKQIETSVAEAELMLGGQSYQAQIMRIESRTDGILQQSEVKIVLQQDGRDSITGTAAALFARARRSRSQSSTIEVYLRRPAAQQPIDTDNTVAIELYAMLLKSLPYQLQRTSDIQNMKHVVSLDGKNGIPDDQLAGLLEQNGYRQQEQQGHRSYTADSKVLMSI